MEESKIYAVAMSIIGGIVSILIVLAQRGVLDKFFSKKNTNRKQGR